MADVTVSDLATLVGASVDRLLGQMKEAGLSHKSADALVSVTCFQISQKYFLLIVGHERIC